MGGGDAGVGQARAARGARPDGSAVVQDLPGTQHHGSGTWPCGLDGTQRSSVGPARTRPSLDAIAVGSGGAGCVGRRPEPSAHESRGPARSHHCGSPGATSQAPRRSPHHLGASIRPRRPRVARGGGPQVRVHAGTPRVSRKGSRRVAAVRQARRRSSDDPAAPGCGARPVAGPSATARGTGAVRETTGAPAGCRPEDLPRSASTGRVSDRCRRRAEGSRSPRCCPAAVRWNRLLGGAGPGPRSPGPAMAVSGATERRPGLPPRRAAPPSGASEAASDHWRFSDQTVLPGSVDTRTVGGRGSGVRWEGAREASAKR